MIKISFIIPTLNAQKVLNSCLKSIQQQNLSSQEYEILIIDGGSTDKTIQIAKKYNSKIIQNPLKTAEAGKAIGVKHAIGKYICLIDSDNILPQNDWIDKMIYPLESDKKIIGSEPIEFTYRKTAGIVERYSALIGANDPYAFITGVYDRKNYINYQWTGLKIDQIDKDKYILITLKPQTNIPTIGANGTIFRTNFLKQNLKTDYLFDIDIISQSINQNQKNIYFAKVKIGIIHTFCESSIPKFIKKQRRRLVDYYQYQKFRQYNWTAKKNPQIKFVIYTITFIPALIDTIKGYLNQPDIVWLLHPIFCYLTLYVYVSISLKNKLGLLKPINRNLWQQ